MAGIVAIFVVQGVCLCDVGGSGCAFLVTTTTATAAATATTARLAAITIERGIGRIRFAVIIQGDLLLCTLGELDKGVIGRSFAGNCASWTLRSGRRRVGPALAARSRVVHCRRFGLAIWAGIGCLRDRPCLGLSAALAAVF